MTPDFEMATEFTCARTMKSGAKGARLPTMLPASAGTRIIHIRGCSAVSHPGGTAVEALLRLGRALFIRGHEQVLFSRFRALIAPNDVGIERLRQRDFTRIAAGKSRGDFIGHALAQLLGRFLPDSRQRKKRARSGIAWAMRQKNSRVSVSNFIGDRSCT